MATAVVRNTAKAALCKEQHLAIPCVGIEGPAMRKGDDRACAPILVINLRPIGRRDRPHVTLLSCPASAAICENDPVLRSCSIRKSIAAVPPLFFPEHEIGFMRRRNSTEREMRRVITTAAAVLSASGDIAIGDALDCELFDTLTHAFAQKGRQLLSWLITGQARRRLGRRVAIKIAE